MGNKCNMSQPYAFISYTHRDSLTPTIEAASEIFNIWWDNEMIPGDKWNDEKAMPAIRNNNCKCVIAFYSEEYMKSAACFNEIEAALQAGKKIIPISVSGKMISEIVNSLSKVLDAEGVSRANSISADLNNGSEKSASENSTIFVNMQDRRTFPDSLYSVLEKYLTPTCHIRNWLKQSADYKYYRDYEDVIKEGRDADEDEDLWSDECGSNYAISLIARLKYALANKDTIAPEEAVDRIMKEIADDYNLVEDLMFDMPLSMFCSMLYDTVCEIPTLKGHMGRDYLPIGEVENRETMIMEFMKTNGVFEGDYFSVVTDDDAIIFSIAETVQTVDKYLTYIERTYPNVIKKKVFDDYD